MQARFEVVVALGLVMRGMFGVVETGMTVVMAVLVFAAVGGVLALDYLLLMVMVGGLIDQVLLVITIIS